MPWARCGTTSGAGVIASRTTRKTPSAASPTSVLRNRARAPPAPRSNSCSRGQGAGPPAVPRTVYPADELVRVVLANDAATADALATALFVMVSTRPPSSAKITRRRALRFSERATRPGATPGRRDAQATRRDISKNVDHASCHLHLPTQDVRYGARRSARRRTAARDTRARGGARLRAW